MEKVSKYYRMKSVRNEGIREIMGMKKHEYLRKFSRYNCVGMGMCGECQKEGFQMLNGVPLENRK